MPSLNDPHTIEVVAKAFCNKGRNKARALRIGGFAEKTATHKAAEMFRDKRLRAAIAEIDTETIKEFDLSRPAQQLKLQRAYEAAEIAEKPAAMVSAVREQNEMLGYHRDKAPNEEKEREKRARMSEEEQKMNEAAAKLRADEESGGKVVKIG